MSEERRPAASEDAEKRIWSCKIGESSNVPDHADGPMRAAIIAAYRSITGDDPIFIFSGWGDELTEAERCVVDDAEPPASRATAEPDALADAEIDYSDPRSVAKACRRIAWEHADGSEPDALLWAAQQHIEAALRSRTSSEDAEQPALAQNATNPSGTVDRATDATNTLRAKILAILYTAESDTQAAEKIVDAALRSRPAEIAPAEKMVLGAEEPEQFVAMLADPPKPNEALRAAFARHAAEVASGDGAPASAALRERIIEIIDPLARFSSVERIIQAHQKADVVLAEVARTRRHVRDLVSCEDSDCLGEDRRPPGGNPRAGRGGDARMRDQAPHAKR